MSFETHLDGPLLHEIYAYWRGKRGLRRMPGRRDIDPVEVPRLLPHLLISDVVDGGARFRYRLTGTEITRALGYDPTGRTVDDIASGSYRDYLNELQRMVCRGCAPLFAESEAVIAQRGRNFFAKRLLLPLSDDGAEVKQILAMEIFQFAAGRQAKLVLEGAGAVPVTPAAG
jgi:hypothetical protein